MLLASDDNNQNYVGARNPDAALVVQFYVKAVENRFESERHGRPIFQDENFVKTMIPGRMDLTLDEPVEQRHINRFPQQWAIFQNKQADAEQTSGTPVTEWPQLSKSQAEELKGKRFYTVEQIANCSDGQIQALGMNANMLRKQARAYLENASNSALAQQQAAEIERKKQEMEDLKASIPGMVADAVSRALAQQAQISATQPKKRGRPKAQPQPEA